MGRKYTCPHERMASVIFLLMARPRTRYELRELLGMTDSTSSINTLTRVLDALEGEGLVRKVGQRDRPGCGGRPQTVYGWCPRQPETQSGE